LSFGARTSRPENTPKNLLFFLLTSSAVALFFGSGFSILRTQSLADSEILGHGSDVRSSSPFKTESKICCSVSPQNGGTPESMM